MRAFLQRRRIDRVAASDDILKIWRWQVTKSCKPLGVNEKMAQNEDHDDQTSVRLWDEYADPCYLSRRNAYDVISGNGISSLRLIDRKEAIDFITRNREDNHRFALIDVPELRNDKRIADRSDVFFYLCDSIPTNNVEKSGKIYSETKSNANTRRCADGWFAWIDSIDSSSFVRNKTYTTIEFRLGERNDAQKWKNLMHFLFNRRFRAQHVFIVVLRVDYNDETTNANLELLRFLAFVRKVLQLLSSRNDVSFRWTSPDPDKIYNIRANIFSHMLSYKQLACKNFDILTLNEPTTRLDTCSSPSGNCKSWIPSLTATRSFQQNEKNFEYRTFGKNAFSYGWTAEHKVR